MEQEIERPDIVLAIRMARARLRAAGEPDTQRGVHRLIGGSRHTVAKYWPASGPRVPGPVEAQPPVGISPQKTDPTPEPAVTLEALRQHYFGTTIVPWRRVPTPTCAAGASRWPTAGPTATRASRTAS